MLLIAAGRVLDEQDAGRFIQGGAPDTVQLWVVPGAGHTGGLEARPDEWEARVTAFLAHALGLPMSRDLRPGSAASDGSGLLLWQVTGGVHSRLGAPGHAHLGEQFET